MSTDKTGGPAFPVNGYSPDFNGMTLRDYFAAKAMNGYISGVLSDHSMSERVLNASNARGLTSEQYFANKSYDVADAMLRARALESE
jgi:hypothetical protein